jgi:DNA-binding transcriptional ArsR family regulator
MRFVNQVASSPGRVKAPAGRKEARESTGVPVAFTFLTHHAHVLVCVATNPTARIRDLAALVGITERAVQRIIAALAAAGYLVRDRQGRRNVYRVREAAPLLHPLERHHKLGALLGAMLPERPPSSANARGTGTTRTAKGDRRRTSRGARNLP